MNKRKKRIHNGAKLDELEQTMNPALIELMIIYYNFLRLHGGLGGSTSAEKLGIKVKVPNK